MSLNTLTIEFTRTLKQSINTFAGESGLTPEEYVRNVVKKDIDLKRYGDINERLNNVRVKEYYKKEESIVIETNYGKITIPVNEFLKQVGIVQEQPKVSTRKIKQEVVEDIKTEETDNSVSVEIKKPSVSSRRKQRIL